MAEDAPARLRPPDAMRPRAPRTTESPVNAGARRPGTTSFVCLMRAGRSPYGERIEAGHEHLAANARMFPAPSGSLRDSDARTTATRRRLTHIRFMSRCQPHATHMRRRAQHDRGTKTRFNQDRRTLREPAGGGWPRHFFRLSTAPGQAAKTLGSGPLAHPTSLPVMAQRNMTLRHLVAIRFIPHGVYGAQRRQASNRLSGSRP